MAFTTIFSGKTDLKNQKKIFRFSLFTLCFLSLSFCPVQAEVSYSSALIAEEYPVGNMLAWETDFEKNSEFFFVEKSEDGINFYKIGQVKAAGLTDSGKKYHYLDVGIQAEKVYYRLKQTDTDGTTSFTEIFSLNKTLLNEFIVVRMNTTDVTESFICTIDNKAEGTMKYEILDFGNHTLTADEITLMPGLNDLQIDTKEFAPGIYKIRLTVNEEVEELVINRIETSEKPVLRASKESQSNGG